MGNTHPTEMLWHDSADESGRAFALNDRITADQLRNWLPGYVQRKVWAARLRAVADLLEED